MGHIRFLLTAAALLLTTVAAAQQLLPAHTLTGRVTDLSGTALPGVVVELGRPAETGSVRSVTTDATGAYRVDRVVPGVYVLTFRLPGFASAIREIEIGGGPPVFEYDVQLTVASLGTLTVPVPAMPTKRVVCGMTMITPPAGVDPGILVPRKAPPGAERVKPTIRTIEPSLCWEPTPDAAPSR